MTREEMQVLAEKAVATWPPLTPEQRDRLYILLAPLRAQLTALAEQQRRDGAPTP